MIFSCIEIRMPLVIVMIIDCKFKFIGREWVKIFWAFEAYADLIENKKYHVTNDILIGYSTF